MSTSRHNLILFNLSPAYSVVTSSLVLCCSFSNSFQFLSILGVFASHTLARVTVVSQYFHALQLRFQYSVTALQLPFSILLQLFSFVIVFCYSSSASFQYSVSALQLRFSVFCYSSSASSFLHAVCSPRIISKISLRA